MNDQETKQPLSRLSEQFMLRMPTGIRSKIKALAVQNRRSVNAQLICMIEAALAASHTTPQPQGSDK